MAFIYEKAVPWGRSFDEYRRMFSLGDDDLELEILGCADGPASFNAEMNRRGKRVISCDPLYELATGQIQERIAATYEVVIRQTRENQDRFIWNEFNTPEELGRIRMQSMNYFLADYSEGLRDGRYLKAELPNLPFAPESFDIALCSHFLFLYSEQHSLGFHQQSVAELCRVAREVRIFPLLTYNAEPSPYVDPIVEFVSGRKHTVSIEEVRYEFQRGGNKMMRISR